MNDDELLALLDVHDSLVMRCVTGDISLSEFLQSYNNFPHVYALDGHEAGEKELELLGRHAQRIRFHFGVLQVLSGLCSDEDAENPLYAQAGRFPPAIGLVRLKQFVAQSNGRT